MIRPVMKDIIFLNQKSESEPETEADKAGFTDTNQVKGEK